ncbi:MAG: tetratricopeptide repeat protein [Cyclobacteriaceae bacterium]
MTQVFNIPFRAIHIVLILLLINQNTISQSIETIDSLNNASFKLRESNVLESISLAREAYGLSTKTNYERGIHHSYINQGVWFINERKLDSAYSLLSKAEAYFKSKKETDNHGISCYQLARIYERLRDYERAETYYKSALELFEQSQNNEYVAYSLNGIGVLNGKQSNYLEALEYFTQAYERKLSAGLTDYDKELNNIAIVYRYMKKFDKAIEFGRKNILVSIQNKDSLGLSSAMDTFGDILDDSGDTDSAFWYYTKSHEIAKKIDNQIRITSVVYEIAYVHSKNGDLDKAIDIHKKTLDGGNIEQSLRENSYSELARLYLKKDLYDSAIDFALRAYKSTVKGNGTVKIIKNAEHLRDGYKLSGRPEMALHYSEIVDKYRDTLETQNRQERFGDLRVRLETIEKEKSIALLEKQAEVDALSRQRLVVVIIAVVLLSLFAFLLLAMRNKNRQKVQFLENQNLKSEIERNKGELYQQTLHMVHINNSYKGVEEELEKLKSEESTAELRRIFQKINVGKLLEKDWENFNKYFGNVHSDFHRQLDGLSASLTQHEKRICALIKVNLTNREIATILSVESKSVRMARYRIKKKLGLEENTKLDDYIQQL